MAERKSPGVVRDAIDGFLRRKGEASLKEIEAAVERRIGKVGVSSVRSHLNLNEGTKYQRVGRGRYRWLGK
jgi:hypothetical protein